MAENEKFDIKKFFGSFFKGLPWIKDLRTISGIVIIVFVGFTLWRAYFVKNQTQSQTSRVIVWPLSFSTINYTNSPQQSQKQEGAKRPWWLPHIFAEGYGFQEGSRTGVGVRAGGRLEW